jgi:hypothetical protein
MKIFFINKTYNQFGLYDLGKRLLLPIETLQWLMFGGLSPEK